MAAASRRVVEVKNWKRKVEMLTEGASHSAQYY